jgi:hypothetical protein
MFSSNASSASDAANYIEDVFSTYLYTASGSTQNVNNGVDLSTKGGLLWIKARTSVGVAGPNMLMNTVSGFDKYLISDQTTAQQSFAAGDVITATTTGFSVPNNVALPNTNYPTNSYTSWTFRKQPKFFDVVTYTGDGTSSKSVSHNLQAVPGFIIAKKTSGTGDWIVCNRYSDTNWVGGNSVNNWGLNSTAAAGAGIDPTTRGITSTTVDVAKLYGTAGSFDATKANANGATYVMYVFAHNAGGFGLTGTDSVTYCGGVSVSGGAGSVTLGWEPQWVLLKNLDTTGAWYMNDNMRGMTVKDSTNATLYSNTADAETSGTAGAHPTATGFTVQGVADGTYAFLAIRRGPMKVPTTGTSVFTPITGNDNTTLTTGFPVDMFIDNLRTGNSYNSQLASRLTGNTNSLQTSSTTAELTSLMSNPAVWQSNTSFQPSIFYSANGVNFAFQRAPSFFDEVCYKGTDTALTLNHNLGVTPEFIICKDRTSADAWYCYNAAIGNTKYIRLDSTAAASSAGSQWWNNTSPTSTTFTAGTAVSTSPDTYVAYLFATAAGVSKVGSYTGTGTTQQINCGFAAGARFIMIKRTDSTGDWYVYDSARGIVVGNDPYLLLNSTAAEVTSTDYVDTYAAGFELSSTAPAALNASGGSYIFLAIA